MITYLEVGDWSRDGHNISETVEVNHNLASNEALWNAYKRGTEVIGFDFSKMCCRDYEESTLTREHFEKLSDFIDIENYAHLDEDEDNAWLHEGSDSFAAIWMEIAKLGNSTLSYSIMDTRSNSLHIGGYGLFFS